MQVWTAYSRQRHKVIAYVIGTAKSCATDLYERVKLVTRNISHIYTDGNSCYTEAFKEHGIKEPHTISIGKTNTFLIESSNSSIRDNLARFNRKSKRYSKNREMLDKTLFLFFNRHLLFSNMW